MATADPARPLPTLTSGKTLWARLALSALLPLLLLAAGCSRVGVAPRPVAAWVAILPDGAEVARVGRVEVPAGTGFTLYAVLEARDWQGETVYFSEAPALEIDGVPVAEEAVRRWSRNLRVRVLWSTVEAFPPYADGSEVVYREVFQGDWPLAWTVTGEITPSVENYLPTRDKPRRGVRFGTQRFKVRLEVLGPESAILPRQSFDSWGAESLPDDVDRFPTVVARLDPPLESLSRVFGLPQREPVSADRAAALGAIDALQRRDLAFSRLTALHRWLGDLDTTFDALAWAEVELDGGEPFAPRGDPLRVGERVVWLLEDRGVVGSLDRKDLCLDFERGARVRALEDVFIGDGLVERARLTAVPANGKGAR